MATGTVKWFNPIKGFGLIRPDNRQDDLFVHILAVQQSGLDALVDRQKVTFDVMVDTDGQESASNIAVI